MENSMAHCTCGKVSFEITGQPLMRGFCHCTICQSVNNAPYADISLFRAADVIFPESEHLQFHSHKFPPVLQRGRCKVCNSIAIEYTQIPLLPRTIIVPSNNIDDNSLILSPSLHIFYDKRVHDVDDDLPKYNGYLMSQLAFGRQMIKSLFA